LIFLLVRQKRKSFAPFGEISLCIYLYNEKRHFISDFCIITEKKVKTLYFFYNINEEVKNEEVL